MSHTAAAPAASRSLPACFTSRSAHADSSAAPSSCLIVGLMSGTSLDGVDAVLAKFDRSNSGSDGAPSSQTPGTIVAHHFTPMPAELRARLLQLNSPAVAGSGSAVEASSSSSSSQSSPGGEIDAMCLSSNALSHLYAESVSALLSKAAMGAEAITAIGCHGQTIRHQPQLPAAPAAADGSRAPVTRAYTLQIGNHALLAELTGIPVVGDFRSRDVAAGGQGAPLVPAFHRAFFGDTVAGRTGKGDEAKTEDAIATASSSTASAAAAHSPAASAGLLILNLGGIANLSHLRADGTVSGFDTGPANVLSDLWIQSRRFPRDQEPGSAVAAATASSASDSAPIHEFDPAGAWAANGAVLPALLRSMIDSEPYFAAAPPKSTGRDLFNQAWLEARGIRLDQGADTQPPTALTDEPSIPPLKAADVAATLVELTALSIAQAVERFCSEGSDAPTAAEPTHTADAAATGSASAPSSPSSPVRLAPILVCGGGAHNAYLLSRLRALLPAGRSVLTTASRGVPAECVEALAFAWLALKFLRGEPANLPAVTGARGARVLGCYYPA